MERILDAKGLVEDNKVISIYIPSVDAILPLRVIYRENRGYEEFNYGPIPVSFSGYEDGVIPAEQETSTIMFRYTKLPPELAEDMFYYTESGKLIHARIKISPILLRVMTEVPLGSKVYSFQDKVTQGLTEDFGWFRGEIEMVFLPKIHVGFRFYNPTNLDLRTNVHITYAEYRVEVVKDVDILYKIVTKQYPAYWISFGGKYRFVQLEDAVRVYGIPGTEQLIPRLPEWTSKEQALSIIREKVKSWKV